MTIIASCGHDISDIPFEEYEHYDYSVMSFAWDGTPAVECGIACKLCKENYRKWGLLLTSEEDEKAYLNGLIDYPLDTGDCC